MINSDFFKSIKIFDGGMGQELLSRGLITKGSLWSASALLEEKYHQLVIDTHIDFINAGANVIVTNNFSARRVRMIENNVNDKFVYANKKAGELAKKAKELSNKKIIIAGSLPAQNDTYVKDERDSKIIEQGFYDQAICLKEYIDFYYLDVISSLRECIIGLSVIKKMKLPALLGLHIKSNGNLPSGEKINEVVNECKKYNILGVIISCVSPEIIEKVAEQCSKLNIPYGFKANLWGVDEPLPVHKFNRSKFNETGTNPNIALGTREDVTGEIFCEFAKNIMKHGATILGGCCETSPSHIKAIANLK